jgi:Undecaprenyl-phosphate glucose phosphotransferase
MTNNVRPIMADAAALTRAQMRADARAPQHRVNRKALGHFLQTIDLFSICLLSMAGAIALSGGAVTLVPAGELLPMLAFAALTPALMAMFGLYRIDPRGFVLNRVLTAFIAAGLSGAAIIALAHYTAPRNLELVAAFALTATSAVTLLHIIYAAFIEHWAKAGRLARNVVLVGATANARKLITANQGSRAVNLVGIFDDRKTRCPAQLAGTPYLGDTNDLFNWSTLPEVDRIILTVTPKAEDRVRVLLTKLRALPQPVCLLLDLEHFDPATTSLEDVVGVQAARMSGAEERIGHLIAKRLQDLVFASLMFVGLLPLMLLVGIAVRLESPGPALFRQQREGFNGRMITVLKFRSMRNSPERADQAVRQVEFNDPRVTRLGGFLRRTSLDELPQLWNVLGGEMSLVGPRPHAPGMRTGGTKTSSLVAEYAHRHRCKPGITGWAQINGSRGPLHTPEAARERIKWDVDYIARSNFWFDLWIMLRTLPALLGDKLNIR